MRNIIRNILLDATWSHIIVHIELLHLNSSFSSLTLIMNEQLLLVGLFQSLHDGCCLGGEWTRPRSF